MLGKPFTNSWALHEGWLGFVPWDGQRFSPWSKASRRMEWACLAKVTSLFIFLFTGWQKENADSAGTGGKCQQGNMHKGYPGCTSASYFSFFSDWFPFFLHPTDTFNKVRFSKPGILHFVHFKDFLSQTTKGVGNCAWSQTQTEPVFLRNLSKVAIQPKRDKNWRQQLLWRFLCSEALWEWVSLDPPR